MNERKKHVAAEVANQVRLADAQGDTALMKAAAKGHADSVSLLSSLSDVGAKNELGLTAMGCAALAGQTECLRRLANVDQGTAGEQADPYLATAIEVFQCLNALSAGPEVLPNTLRSRGATPEGLAAGLDHCLANAGESEASVAMRFEAMAAIGPERLPHCCALEEKAQLAAEDACDSARAARVGNATPPITLAKREQPREAALSPPAAPQLADAPRPPPPAAEPPQPPRRAMRL